MGDEAGRGYSTKRWEKCAVCFTVWDRAPEASHWAGTEAGAPCTGCGRHPGKSTPVSCAGCANAEATVHFRDRYGFVIHLCVTCNETRRALNEAKLAATTPSAPDHAPAPYEKEKVFPYGIYSRPAADYPTREGIGRVVARTVLTQHIASRSLVDGKRVAVDGDCGGTWGPDAAIAMQPKHVLGPGEAHRYPWAATFDLKALAQSIFATDPRVQAIVNRVTVTKPPRYTKKARMAREREEHPVYVMKRVDLNEEELAGLARANQLGSILDPQAVEVEFIGPKETPRQRRGHAFDVAWKRERGLRHEAIRRAVFIARGATRR